MIEFTAYIDPPRATHQMRKIAVVGGKPRTYEPEAVKAARETLGWAFAPHRPKRPLEGPLALSVRWAFRAGRGHKSGQWKTTRPDTDNLQKALKDELGRLGFYRDDAQVCVEVCSKIWAREPHIYIKLEELEEKCGL